MLLLLLLPLLFCHARHDLPAHRQLVHAAGRHPVLGHHVATHGEEGGRLVRRHSSCCVSLFTAVFCCIARILSGHIMWPLTQTREGDW
jgi:hypothetical protein